MKFWTTAKGEKVTFREFMKRWKKGIKKVAMEIDMVKQVNQQIRFTQIIIFGLILGIGVSIYKITDLWWVMIILIGALGNTSIQLIALFQKKEMIKSYSY